MDSQPKMKFPSMCRDMRVAHNLRQREVADAIGVKVSSYGNVESNNHKTIAIDRVKKLASFYTLDEAATAALIAAWEELPASEYSQKQTKSYAERNARRSKARNHDRLKVALLEMTTIHIAAAASPDELCTCARDDFFTPSEETEACEVCNALQLLGLSGYTNRDEVIAELAKLQEAMT